jgi:hypothetical protein
MKKASQLIQEIKDIATEEDILAVLNVSDGYISKTLLDMTSSKQYQTQNSND